MKRVINADFKREKDMVRFKFFLGFLFVSAVGIHFSCTSDNRDINAQSSGKGLAKNNTYPNYKRPKNIQYPWKTSHHELLVNRHPLPKGFELTKVVGGSFEDWLRCLPLKPKGTPIKLFNGKKKMLQALNAGVLDIDVGKTDLQQCADAVIRLKAEYLYSKKKFTNIHFNYTSGFKAEYSKWREGYKIGVKDNKAYYYKKSKSTDKTYEGFRKYLWNVYNYAGTYSLNKELKKQSTKNIKGGDVLIIGGFPGHVVMVAAVAENASKEKAVLLIQSYMPAQNIHIVKKQLTRGEGVWFKVSDLEKKGWKTWEFDYKKDHLKTWLH
ncbi:MAG: DUF4846 domain-containing protein [Flavobacteriales bacterium]